MKNLPVANLKIQFKLGSNIWETYTQSNGYFSITNAIPLEATYSQIFQHPRWKITMENSTSPISYTLGTVQDAWHNNTDKTFTTYSYAEFPVYEILRAVNYYYNGNHSIRTWHYDEGIRIRALTKENETSNGYFTYSYMQTMNRKGIGEQVQSCMNWDISQCMEKEADIQNSIRFIDLFKKAMHHMSDII